MKKIFAFNLALIVILSIAFASCSNNKGDVGDNIIDADTGSVDNTDESNADSATEKKEILHRQQYEQGNSKKVYDDFIKYVEELQATKNNKKEMLDVPVYYEKELLTQEWFFIDSSIFRNFSSAPRFTGKFFASFPTSAIRLNGFGFSYSVHDTETGYRAFTFFADDYHIQPVGFMIAIKDVLTYSDFLELSIGDPIEDVEKIDSIASLYKRQFVDGWKVTPETTSSDITPLVSVHYLKEGLLKIEYGMPEDGKLVITKIEFNKDRIMKDFLGNDINYTIDELDLPA